MIIFFSFFFFTFSFVGLSSTIQFQLFFLVLSYFIKLRIKTCANPKGPMTEVLYIHIYDNIHSIIIKNIAHILKRTSFYGY